MRVGDVVLAGDEFNPNAPVKFALVTGVSHRTVYEQTTVTYVDAAGNVEVIRTTGNHEFFVEGVGWKAAQLLTAGQQLLLPDGKTATVTSVEIESIPGGIIVYNFSVTDGATYFVDDGQGDVSAVWVHNRRLSAFGHFIRFVRDGKEGASAALGRALRKSGSLPGRIKLAQAHHIIPIGTHKAFQVAFAKAAKAGWNVNGAKNGMWRGKQFHQGLDKQSHDVYNEYVTQTVGKWLKSNKNASGEQIKNYLEGLSGRLKQFLDSNPKKRLDNLFDVLEP